MSAVFSCDGSCGGHVPSSPGCKAHVFDNTQPANICLVNEACEDTTPDELKYPWVDSYPVSGQRVLWGNPDGSGDIDTYTVFGRTDELRTLVAGQRTVLVQREECRPLGWDATKELCVLLGFNPDDVDIVEVLLESGHEFKPETEWDEPKSDIDEWTEFDDDPTAPHIMLDVDDESAWGRV